MVELRIVVGVGEGEGDGEESESEAGLEELGALRTSLSLPPPHPHGFSRQSHCVDQVGFPHSTVAGFSKHSQSAR